ncbi:hypothetical protein [Brachybacterium sp.]|uniref:hypothetical protein n=1 Tax=Brachybacterium sp. TaxID=1891286 RepID=UPI002ED09485
MSDVNIHDVHCPGQDAGGHPSEIFTAMNGGLPIDIRYEPHGYDMITVFFHVALAGGTYRYPVLTGAGISEDLAPNRWTGDAHAWPRRCAAVMALVGFPQSCSVKFPGSRG